MTAFFPDGLCEILGDLCSQEHTVGSPGLTTEQIPPGRSTDTQVYGYSCAQ